MNFRRVEIRVGYIRKTAILVLLASLLMVFSTIHAIAAPPKVALMPGFPMLAGNVVMVMWAPVPGAVKYQIYLNGKIIGEAPMPPFQFETPKESMEYLVVVTAVDGTGAEGEKSSPGKFIIQKLEAPTSLEILRKGDKGEAVALRWVAPKGANIYNIYRKDLPGDKFKLLISTQDIAYVDTTVQVGKKYEYAVSAKDMTGKESGMSVPKQVEIMAFVTASAKEKVVAVPRKSTYEIITPTGIEIVGSLELRAGKDGFLYLLDSVKQTIRKFDVEGKYVDSIGKGGFLPGQFQSPEGFCFLPDGGFAVVDSGAKKVVLLLPDGEFIREFPIPGQTSREEKLEFPPRPAHIAVTKDGNLAVVDGPNRRVVVLTQEGKFVTDFLRLAKAGERGIGFVKSPNAIAVDGDGNLFIADVATTQIQVYGPDYKGKFLIGHATGPGSFVSPGKIAIFEKEGALLVPDGMLATIQGFSLKDGKYLFTLTGESGKLEKDQLPVWDLGSTRTASVAPDGTLWVLLGLEKKFAHIRF